ncbi:hypothetical protein MXE95_17375 [Aeromonas caviae]|uniref:O-antigen ligase family protein n=1 Tax=Aeromonas TaxID=642 RepID=UPI0022E06AC5|nr:MULTISPECIES: O-antigen ligase family protein [Aeromonas]MEB5775834.1 hypothetical protein [Aeromonas caviae]MEB6651060.1 hypothetical protein [Aeromonas caviae]
MFSFFLGYFLLFVIVAILVSFAQFLGGVYVAEPEYPFAILRTTPSLFNGSSVYLFVSIGLAICISLYIYQLRQNKLFVALAFLLFICILLTFSRKSILVSALVLFSFFVFLGAKNLSGIRYFCFSIFILISASIVAAFLFYSGLLDRYTLLFSTYFSLDGDVPARTLLYLHSLMLAEREFPLGTGPGSFASAYAATNYSNIYTELGYESVMGLQPMELGGPNYLMDTFWPHVIAEYGFLGGGVYLALWLYPCYRVIKNRNKIPARLIFLVLSCYFVIFIESLGGSYPSQLYFVIMYSFVSVAAFRSLDAKSFSCIKHVSM